MKKRKIKATSKADSRRPAAKSGKAPRSVVPVPIPVELTDEKRHLFHLFGKRVRYSGKKGTQCGVVKGCDSRPKGEAYGDWLVVQPDGYQPGDAWEFVLAANAEVL